ncbi:MULTISPECIES: hypothetical protein [Brucella]|uniref:hypothetical protein n=1 Tax=Brucella TaxID=234 RepID=UPI00124D63D4|nr:MULTISPECIES: hypothetical protein [Brucella]KAB2678490.1 hypothetical protein F9K78_20460 [Brucella pseudintermedia]KAB2707147.1 hypothetical protein F9K80_18545 [Brucella intermedia]
MPTRNVVPDEHHQMAQLNALRKASRIGFTDLVEGRFVDVPADKLEGFIADLGREAGERRARPKRSR